MSSEANPESPKPAPRRQPLQFSLRMLLILVTLVAAISGFFRWRWLNSPELILARQRVEFSERFKEVPLEIGPWKGEEIEVTPNVLDAYDSRGAAIRLYRNSDTGAEMHLIVKRGPAGPTSVYFPEIVYTNEKIMDVKRLDFGLSPEVESIKIMEMVKENGEHYFRVVTFSPTGIWSVPEIPRIEFGQEKELTKLELNYSNPTKKSSAENWLELEETVQLFIPHLQQVLFPQSKAVTVDSRWLEWLPETSFPWAQLIITTASIVGLIVLSRRRKTA